jgi:hypothetical protein
MGNLTTTNHKPARLAADGKRVLCGAQVMQAQDGSIRFRCGEPLGEVLEGQVERNLNNGTEETFLDTGKVFYLRADIAPSSEFFRKTERPHHRNYGPENRIVLRSSRYPASETPRRIIRKHDKEETDWGEDGTFSLREPLEVLCPRCHKINVITEKLLKTG